MFFIKQPEGNHTTMQLIITLTDDQAHDLWIASLNGTLDQEDGTTDDGLWIGRLGTFILTQNGDGIRYAYACETEAVAERYFAAASRAMAY